MTDEERIETVADDYSVTHWAPEEMYRHHMTEAFKAGVKWRDQNPHESVISLRKVLNDNSYQSVRETLALMSDGEGSDSEVYRLMSKAALKKLDAALLEFDQHMNADSIYHVDGGDEYG